MDGGGNEMAVATDGHVYPQTEGRRTRALKLMAKLCFSMGLGGVALCLLIGLASYGEWYYLPLYLVPFSRPQWLMVLFLLVGFLFWRRAGKKLRELLPGPMQVRLADLVTASLFTGFVLAAGRADRDFEEVGAVWWIDRAPRLCMAFGCLFLLSLVVTRARGKSGGMLVAHALISLLLSLGVLSILATGYLCLFWWLAPWGPPTEFWWALKRVLAAGWYENGSHDCFLVFLRLGLLALPLGLFLRRLVCTVERCVAPDANSQLNRIWQAALWIWCVGLFATSFFVLKWSACETSWEWLTDYSQQEFRWALLSIVLLFSASVLLCLASPRSSVKGVSRAALMAAVALGSFAPVMYYLGVSRASWWVIIVCGLAAITVMSASSQDRVGTVGRVLVRYGLISAVVLLLPAYLNALGPDVAWPSYHGSFPEFQWADRSGQLRVVSFWKLHHGLVLALTGAAILLSWHGFASMRRSRSAKSLEREENREVVPRA